MIAVSLVIAVDRGGLMAYNVVETPSHGAQLKLVQAFDIPNVNDLSRTRHTTATTSWPQLEAEETEPICKQLAEAITQLVKQLRPNGWSLAAPQSLYHEIIAFLTPEVRERIVEQIYSDLRKIPAKKLPKHFRSLQPI